MSVSTPEALARQLVEDCADCGLCRDIMDDMPCLFFPVLYRLHDKEKAGAGQLRSEKLKTLLDFCNSCGQCPCASIRVKIREAKDAFIERDGLAKSVRIIEDVRLVGRVCGAIPRLANLLTQNEPTAAILKKTIGIHPDRKLPEFPVRSFGAWAKQRGLHRMRPANGRKVAYFTGCTARYLFPEVAKATVEVLEHNGIAVYLPKQHCCGMPTMLEGDRRFTFDLVGRNMPELRRCIEAGYDIVTSCPTCSYMFKSVLRDGAFYAEDYRTLVTNMAAEMEGNFSAAQNQLTRDETAFTGRANASSAWGRQPWLLKHIVRGRFPNQVRDEGYFASIAGLDRIRIASHTYELGEYLRELHQTGELELDLGKTPQRTVYFPPCHLKEQDMGQPWMDLLRLIPGNRTEKVGDTYDCCGLGGVMGFKKRFHNASLAMGRPTMEKIKAAAPDCVATDCLSCRLQFNQMLPYKGAHPVEILWESYRSH